MDKRSLLAIVLMAVIVIAWMFYASRNTVHQQVLPPDSTNSILNQADSQFKAAKKTEKALSNVTDTNQHKNDSLDVLNKYGTSFAKLSYGKEDTITVETDDIIAKISSKGASILEWTLKKYKMWNGYPTQLIWNKGGELFLAFTTRENEKIDTRDMYFKLENVKQTYYKLKGRDSVNLTFKLEPEHGKYILRKYTFYGNSYQVNTTVTLTNMDNFIPVKGYRFLWTDGLRYQERNSVDESGDAETIVLTNGDPTSINAGSDDTTHTGTIDYVGVKSKYFAAAIIPQPFRTFDGTVILSGTKESVQDEGVVEKYRLTFIVPYKGGNQSMAFKVYIGPLSYDIVREYGLEAMINFGWRWIVRPIGEFFMLPIFKLINNFVGNFGIAIIIFSLLMKILLYPLSIQQMRSAQRMQLISPEITKIREKYKDDNKKQQEETMKVYSQFGINPAGGCLPLILQMPILYALWGVLRTAIDLRQANFILWITDLSLPDTLFRLPISFLGIKQISGLALFMGATMFIQQKMTVTDPRQKSLVYVMPIMFTLMFSNFPSGLNLYYFMFNLMGITQQFYLNNFSKKKLTLEDIKKMPKKEGWLQKKMREAQEIASSQGRSIPGQQQSQQNKQSQNNKRQPTKAVSKFTRKKK